jgi:23S rRNA (uracil1939-C5)-methyltransferase
MIGFHARKSDTMVEILECPLIEPALLAGLDGLREITVQFGSRKGSLKIAATVTQNGLDVWISEGKDLSPKDSADLGAIAAKHEFCRIAWNGDVIVQAAPATVSFGSTKIPLPEGAFLQATKHGEDTLVKSALEAVAGYKSGVDVFECIGTFAIQAALTSTVHAVEGDANMTGALDAAWRGSTGLKPVTSETRDLFERPLLEDELSKYEAVIIDPPRAGAQVQCREIAASKVRKVAFVSCNPGTFTRDAKILVKGGFTLDWVQVVDQFRWSSHVELGAQFTLDR